MSPDFTIVSESQDVSDDTVNDLWHWWEDLPTELRNDYLSSWDALVYGDHTNLDGYDVVYMRDTEHNYHRFMVVAH